MKNLWKASDAEKFAGALGECVYGSRLLGADPALVLHGGGNTSVKTREHDIHGEEVDVLHVKEAAGISQLLSLKDSLPAA